MYGCGCGCGVWVCQVPVGLVEWSGVEWISSRTPGPVGFFPSRFLVLVLAWLGQGRAFTGRVPDGKRKGRTLDVLSTYVW